MLPMTRESLLKWIPSVCPACHQSALPGVLCPVCQSFLNRIQEPCPICGEPDCESEICGRCQKQPPSWQQAQIPWHFDGLCRHLIHQYKYHQDTSAGRALLHHWFQTLINDELPDAVAAVPMHHRRQHQKGGNQAEWLARRISKHLHLPYWNGCRRIRQTATLEDLNRNQRRRELKGAFELLQKPPKSIAIVDDVFTTGATVSELSRVLKKAGSTKIHIWALARTPLGKTD